ncbi:NAD(P)-dependent oxidoreductase [Ancylobacter sp. A5.8]|uniref:NAD-dependent epimerase/dehydratase family protein n=1 Tax=Ancylobacter gelatini TaxID=2919920 RepID=UPI001F4D653F|nr:NAD(P)-dependent oxidoreductase [Ancylobacter gelatini]MCJ8142521.1 NAD(P)-dependent oxidoreductase [Ancylobacter gelatini]
MSRLLLTGASGALGRQLAARLAAAGHHVLLTDIMPFPDPVPERCEFRAVDLADRETVLALGAAGVDAVLHFGAASTERAFEEVLGPNILGTHHVFDLARAAKARLIFASSNHAIGFHERGEILDEDCALRPDGYYGLTKAYGELLARLYFDKHGLESLSLRIGTCAPKPTQARHLSTWLSLDDLMRLIEAGLRVERLGCRVAWGVSANARSWWRHTDPSLGYEPQDDAEAFAAALEHLPEPDPVTAHYQGGPFCAIGYDCADDGWDGTPGRR